MSSPDPDLTRHSDPPLGGSEACINSRGTIRSDGADVMDVSMAMLGSAVCGLWSLRIHPKEVSPLARALESKPQG